VAFWKEEPQLHYALDLVESSEVFAVPVFMAEGYFTDRVVPRELGLDRHKTVRGGRKIHYCPPVGTDPRMDRIVLDRAAEVVSLPNEVRSKATLVVLGHGTDRHPRSADTTLSLVGRLRKECRYDRVVAAFLDQDPFLDRVLEDEVSANTIVVPLFVSEGWHVGTTVPCELALKGETVKMQGRRVWYAKPAGTHFSVAEVVRNLVDREKATESVKSESLEKHDRSVSPATAAKKAFFSWIRAASGAPRVFLQTSVWSSESGKFEIRHERDQTAAAEALRSFYEPDEILAIASMTAEGTYRPLKTAPDLTGGWRFANLTEDQVWEVYARLYPAAPVHCYLQSQGRLPVVSFREASKRQTGIYSAVGTLRQVEVGALVEGCCSEERCLRNNTWWTRGEVGQIAPPGLAVFGGVPCPAPCSVFFSHAASELDPP